MYMNTATTNYQKELAHRFKSYKWTIPFICQEDSRNYKVSK